MIGYASVLIRLLSAWIIFINLSHIPFVINSSGTSSNSIMPIVYMAYPFILIIFGMLLWIFPQRISSWVIKGIEVESEDHDKIDAGQLVGAGSFLIGLYWTIIQFSNVANTLYYESLRKGEFELNSITNIIGLILGIFLMVRFRTIVNLFEWLRVAGQK